MENLNYKVFLLPLLVLLVLFALTYALTRRWGKEVGTSLRRGLLFCGMLVTLPISCFVVRPAQLSTMSYLYMAPVERIYIGTTSCIADAERL